MSILKQLNEIKIDDLKNIDFVKLLGNLKQKPDALISIALVFVALFASFKIFGKTGNETRSIRSEIPKLEEKLKALGEQHAAEKNLETFLKNIPPKMTESEFLNFITDMAVSHAIQIKSFSPIQRTEKELYAVASTSLDLTLTDYKSLWSFIYDIEHSPHLIYISKWQGGGTTLTSAAGSSSRASRYQRQGPVIVDPKNMELQVNLEIALVTFKNETK